MAATLTISFTPATPTPSGYTVKYRVKGTTGSYTTVTGTSSPIIISGLAYNTEYEGTIESDCGSEPIEFATCTCPPGFTLDSTGNSCEDIDQVPATITYSNYCLAPSKNGNYSQYFTRIYNVGFSNTSIGLYNAPPSDVIAELNSFSQWMGASETTGPMNRCAVWIDSDCNGTKDALATGVQTTLAFAFNNTGDQRTVYVGIGADNQFSLVVNNINVAQTPTNYDNENFKIWHVFPVTLEHGWNYFNAVGTGDGSVNDSIGMTIYDSTATQLQNATNDNQLTILFTTSSLIGQNIDIATCPNTYNLDTTGGQGNYVCVKIIKSDCSGIFAP